MKDVRKLKLQELNRIGVEEFKERTKVPVVIVLDNIRSGLNVGSVFRTSDAFLIDKVYLCGITATPPHKEILKTAIGANHSVEWEYSEHTIEVISALKATSYSIIGIEQTTNSIPLNDFAIDPNHKYAIVMGNEVDGVQEESLKMIDHFIEIPQFGTKHSLNVSVCAGIVMHHFAFKFLG